MRKLYLFIVSMLVAVAASAAGTTATVNIALYKELGAHNSGNWDETIAQTTAEATIEGGVVTISNFLQGGKDIKFTAYDDGSATHDWGSDWVGSAKGSTFVLGDWASTTYVTVQDFVYGEDYGKYIGGFIEDWDYDTQQGVYYWAYIYFPDTFVPEKAPYLGVPVTVKATVSDWYKTMLAQNETIDMTIYINGNTINIPKYWGSSKTYTYTLSDSAVSGGVTYGAADIDLTVGDVQLGQICGIGGQASYKAEAREITDAFWVYKANSDEYTWLNVTFALPKLVNATITRGSGKDAVSKTIQMPYKQGPGKIQFPNIFSSDLDVTFAINEIGEVTNDIEKGGWHYNVNYGELGTGSLYASNDDYFDQYYTKPNGVMTLNLGYYFGYGQDDWQTTAITLPEDFEPTLIEKDSQVYRIVDGVVTDEAIPAVLGVSVNGSTIEVLNILNIQELNASNQYYKLSFTVQSDGVVSTNYGMGGFTKTYAFNGDFYARLIDFERTYNTVNKTFTWKFALAPDTKSTDPNDYEQYAFIYKFDDDFVPTNCTANIYGKNRKGTVYLKQQDKTATLDLTELDNRSVTLTNAFNAPTNIKFTWDKSGKLSWEGGFNEIKDDVTTVTTNDGGEEVATTETVQTYYTIGGKRVGSFTIGAASKHVIDGQDEYLELILTSDGENPTYQDAIYRVFIAKASVDNTKTLTGYTYKYDEGIGDYGDDYKSTTYVYTIEDGVLTLENFLDSEYDITLQFYNKVNKDDDEGAIGTSLQEGDIYNTYTIFGEEKSVITYEGDEYQVEEPVEETDVTEAEGEVKPTSTGGDSADSAADDTAEAAKTVIKTYYNAGWYVDRGTKYAFIDFGSGDDWYELMFYVPSGVVYTTKPANSNTSAVNTIAVEDNNEDAPVEYFNLQGVRVNNPANGLYIRRQGSKVTKVIVK